MRSLGLFVWITWFFISVVCDCALWWVSFEQHNPSHTHRSFTESCYRVRYVMDFTIILRDTMLQRRCSHL